MAGKSLAEQVNSLQWFHQIDLGDGLITPGRFNINDLKAFGDAYFGDDIVKGKSFLDIGCWDGANSFEADRRGAKRVLATDHHVWSDAWGGWGDRRCFDLARKTIAPKVKVKDIALDDLSPETVGTFDVVLFAGVFYHLRHPLLVMEQIAKLAAECLIVETHVEHFGEGRPGMIFYPGHELGGDGSNWWGPNPECVEAMLRDVGFPYVQTILLENQPSRGIFRGFKTDLGLKNIGEPPKAAEPQPAPAPQAVAASRVGLARRIARRLLR